jgi:tetratricopeptide (TPR) repeat protein
VSPASCRALVEAQYHRCKADAADYVAWFEAQFGNYLNAYYAQPLRPLAEQMIGICEQQFGVDHPETAKALTNLARVILQLGGVEKAEPLLRRAISIQETGLPADHPDIARTFAVLGGYYSGRGDLAGAEPFFRRALDIREKVLGIDHPLTLGIRDNLAKIALELGRLDEAEALSRQGAGREGALFRCRASRHRLRDHRTRRSARQARQVRRPRCRCSTVPSPSRRRRCRPTTPTPACRCGTCRRHCAGSAVATRRSAWRGETLAMWESKLGPEHEWTAWGLISLAETRLAQGAAERGRTARRTGRRPGPGHLRRDPCADGLDPVPAGSRAADVGDALAAERLLARAIEIQAPLDATGDDVTKATQLLERTREKLAAALILVVAGEWHRDVPVQPMPSPERGVTRN